MYRAGLDNADDYFHDVALKADRLTEGEIRDLHAFQIALQNRSSTSSRAVVTAVGPIPGGVDAVSLSVQVYEAGLTEVEQFLAGT
jgi:hypothetical protein